MLTYDQWLANYNKICGCKDVRPAYLQSDFGIEWFRQCQNCGLSRADGDFHGIAVLQGPANAVIYDLEAHQAFIKKRADEWTRYLVKATTEAAKKKKGYHEYLGSEDWQAMRTKVLMRDKWICQGCLKERATQVHHTTYAHVKAELCFELVSLCEACHKRIHDK